MSNFFEMNSQQAENKFDIFRDKDPFPDIAPALLNSADVSNYIKTIGMICPFDIEQLNGVTLTLTVGKLGLYWNEEKEKIMVDISSKGEFILKSNTIAYVSIGEFIRLPAYIIARFNLRVMNAYKGILLGTGPIVDPGFEGNLFIPLHNLTNNDYVFYFKEPFIEMEFTKISPNKLWMRDDFDKHKIICDGEYVNWKPKSEKDNISSKDRRIDYYLRRANLGRSIESSLPSLKKDTREAIEKSTKTSERVDTSLGRINVGLLFSFGALLTAIIAVVNIFRGDIKEIKDKKLDDRLKNLEQQSFVDSSTIRYLNKQHTLDSQKFKSLRDELQKKGIIEK